MLELRRHPLNRRAFEKIRIVDPRAFNLPFVLRYEQHDIETRGFGAELEPVDFHSRQIKYWSRCVLHNEEHLDHRITAEIAWRLDLFHEFFKRQFLARVSFE